MKTRLIISDRSWKYRLQAAPQQPGAYYVKLAGANGEQLMHAPIVGPFPTLDAIVDDPIRIYRRLLEMFQTPFFPAASARDNSQITDPTTTAGKAETKETKSKVATAAYDSGHPGIDRYLE